MKVGVVVFPGSNCDQDLLHACRDVLRWDTTACWHANALPPGLDLLLLPGGFSHGDYLRAGALAARAPIMADVIRFADAGGHVLGICNGFQILCESGLLPGTLRVNRDLQFHCQDVWVRVENHATPFTVNCPPLLRLPIAHKEGNYHADEYTLARLNHEERVVFRYCDPGGAVTDAGNPNGSLQNIAGIMNGRGNVCGLMPHPERVCEAILGGTDGLAVFRSLETALPTPTAAGGRA
jgi:phosphoribosylformylglycinamidine synthase